MFLRMRGRGKRRPFRMSDIRYGDCEQVRGLGGENSHVDSVEEFASKIQFAVVDVEM